MKLSHLYEDFTVVNIGDCFRAKENITKEMLDAIYVSEDRFRQTFGLNKMIVSGYADGCALYTDESERDRYRLELAKKLGIYDCLWVRFNKTIVMYPITYFDRVII